MKIVTTLRASPMILLLGLLGANSSHAADPDAQQYIMVVYADRAHGEQLVEGESDKVIAKLRGGEKSAENFAEQVSLCVAFTKSKQFTRAAEFCDMALAGSEREARRLRRNDAYGRYSARVAMAPKAIALTNRGVLHALAGEPEEAEVYFEMAQESDLIEDFAERNLAHLRHSLDATGT